MTCRSLLRHADEPILLLLDVPAGGGGPSADPARLARLRNSRAVTAAVAAGTLQGGALELVLSCDLVYLREDAVLDAGSGDGVPPPGVVRAFFRAGHRALHRVLLDPRPVDATEAERLGVASGLLGTDDPLPIPTDASLAALATARDLARTSGSRAFRLALEKASFQLLFATGDPEEGARAFLERRSPRFPSL